MADGGEEVRAFEEWLEETAPARAAALTHYPECRRLQAEFRDAVAEVVSLALAGKETDARQQISPGSRFAEISTAFTNEMTVWFGETERG